jgi:AraC-like DNA-binding protein
MVNIYDYIANSKYYKIFKVNDLLMVEYKCMLPAGRVAFWTHNNYIAYILSGEATYSRSGEEYVFKKGEAMFVRRGAYISEQHRQGDYCALIMFLSDDFIRTVVDKYPVSRNADRQSSLDTNHDCIFPVEIDESMYAYFYSMLTYFSKDAAPSGELLKLKFEEFVLNILMSGRTSSLSACLRSIRECGKVSLRNVMDRSFMYPMSLSEFARLCARSLSTFKADFQEIYKTSPGRWLLRERLNYAKILLETTDETVGNIASTSGFKNTTHFVRVFKGTYGMPPLQYRLNESGMQHNAPAMV